MQCPKCTREVGKVKKHHVIICKCNAKLMCVEVKKELILLDLKNYKGEN